MVVIEWAALGASANLWLRLSNKYRKIVNEYVQRIHNLRLHEREVRRSNHGGTRGYALLAWQWELLVIEWIWERTCERLTFKEFEPST